MRFYNYFYNVMTLVQLVLQVSVLVQRYGRALLSAANSKGT